MAGLVVGPVLIEPLIQAAVPPALAAGIDWSILTEQATVDTSREGLVYVTEVNDWRSAWRLEYGPPPGSSILVEAWRPAAVLALATVAVALVAALGDVLVLAGSPVEDRSGDRRGPDVGQRPVCRHCLP